MATNYDLQPALPNKMINSDDTITDLLGNPVDNSVMEYQNKKALPNKWLNPDGTYSTLAEIISGAIDTELFIVVEELPPSGETNKIYLLVDGDKLVEYHWTGTKWDPIGMVEIDISQYSTTEQMNQAITTALNNAKAYTDGKLAEAKSYSDDNLDTAKDYSDNNLDTAKAYSDANLDAAKDYTDLAIQHSITNVLEGEY